MCIRLLVLQIMLTVAMIRPVTLALTTGTFDSVCRQRSWAEVPRSQASPVTPEVPVEAQRIRVLSYNVLGPRHGLTSKHAHCPKTLRRWTKRSERLLEEIREYHTCKPGGLHAVCLQEVTPKTLKDTWVPFMKTLGLDRHVYQPKSQTFNTDQLEKTAQMRVFFPEQVHRLGVHGHSRIATKAGDDRGEVEDIGRAGKPTKSRLKHDLSSKPDAAVMVRMRWKGSTEGEKDMATPDGNVSGDDFRESPSFTIVCCHFCFDPFRPDLKTAQCRMLFDAINDFHEDCGVSAPTGVTGYHPGEKHFRAGESPANLIMCGDFNSIPIMNPEFLPGPIKAPGNKEAGTQSADMFALDSASIYPSSKDTASGVYSLLSYGHVSCSHPEHPDTFIPELIRREEAGGADVRLWKEGVQDGPPSADQLLQYGTWKSGFGETLEDAYRGRGVVAPRFTTKTSQFSGVIDHIFVSSSERNSGLVVTGVLAFPAGADMTLRTEADCEERRGGLSSTVGHASDFNGGNAVVQQASGGSANATVHSHREFGPIPDEVWGSDHLALGVEVALLSTIPCGNVWIKR